MTSVLNTNASLPYSHDLFESLIVKKRIKVDGGGLTLENVAKCQNTPYNEKVISESEQDDTSFAEYFATTSIWATTEVKSYNNARNLNTVNEVDAESQALEPVEAQSAGDLVSRSGGLQRALRAFDIIVNMENAAGPCEIVDALAAEHYLKEAVRCDARQTRDDSCSSANSVFDSMWMPAALENVAKCQNTPYNEKVISESEQDGTSFAEYFATTSIWATTEVKSYNNARNLNTVNEVDAESQALEPVEAQSAGDLVSRSGGLQRALRYKLSWCVKSALHPEPRLRINERPERATSVRLRTTHWAHQSWLQPSELR
ncbi:hypothetical protein T265_12622, partial [Opisthorchis viverrini]